MKLFDCYGFEQLIEKYEELFRNRDELRKEKEFHVENLQTALDAADEILALNAEEIEGWAKAFEEVYAIEPRNVLEKVRVFFMGRYTEWRYEFAIEESELVGKQKEIIQDFQNKLLLM